MTKATKIWNQHRLGPRRRPSCKYAYHYRTFAGLSQKQIEDLRESQVNVNKLLVLGIYYRLKSNRLLLVSPKRRHLLKLSRNFTLLAAIQ